MYVVGRRSYCRRNVETFFTKEDAFMNVKKRTLALIMCLCMLFSLMPFSAFADGAQQDIVYRDYDAQGNWGGADLETASKTYTSDNGTNITYSKTAEKVEGQTDVYDITLRIESTTTETTPGASAVVLVIDSSGSMAWCAECGKASSQHGGESHTFKTRMSSAVEAAKSFVTNYGANGSERYLAVVDFANYASALNFGFIRTINWLDVSNASNASTVRDKIDSNFAAGGGTNLQQGLTKAQSLLSDRTVSGISAANKYVVVMTDGRPTRYGSNASGDGEITDTNTYNSTKTAATSLKSRAQVYTVCYGATGDICYGSETVSQFLSSYIASSSGKAYDASNTADLNNAFTQIFRNIENGISSGFTVTDPLGENILLQGSLPENCTATADGFTWTPASVTPTENADGSKTYVYTVTYRVKLDTEADGFVDDLYYPTNGDTLLRFTDNEEQKTLHFAVPGVKGKAPVYSVSYEFDESAPAEAVAPTDSSSYKKGAPVTVQQPAGVAGYVFNGWTLDSSPVSGTFTMPAKNVTLIGSWSPRSDLSYTVNYYWNTTDTKIAESDTVGSKTLNDKVKLEPKAISGYTALPGQETELVIAAEGNVVNFYYYKNVEITANSKLDAVYNGSTQSVSGFTGAPEGADFSAITVGAEGKNAGNYPAAFAQGTVGTVDGSEKYIITKATDGKLVISPVETVVVTIEGNTKEAVYTGSEQFVEGYKVSINNKLYTEADFAFTGSDRAAGTDADEYPMGLAAGQFNNTNANFKNVVFNVTDGKLTITKKTVEFKGESASLSYNGTEQTITGITATGLIDGHSYSGLSYAASGTYAGTYPGVFSGTAVIKDAGGNDVSKNYDVKTTVGALTITKTAIPVVFNGQSDTQEYTGNVITITGITPNGLISGHTWSGLSYAASGTDAGTYDGAFTGTAVICDESGTDVTEYYKVSTNPGALTITPVRDEVTVKIVGNTAIKQYTGSTQTVEGYNVDSISDARYSAEYIEFTKADGAVAAGILAGTYNMNLAPAHFGNTSTNFTNVTFEVEDGWLKITPRETIIITAASGSKTYDGTALTNSDYSYTEGVLADGDEVVAVVEGSITNVGSAANNVTSYKIMRGDTDVTASYAPAEFVPGTLTVSSRDVTFTGESKDVIYNGKDQSITGITATGLVDGHSYSGLSYLATGLKTGVYPGAFSGSAIIVDADGNDVTANYEPKTVPGVLTIQQLLEKDEHFNYVIGYPDGTIRPEGNISRAEVAAIFFRLLTDNARAQYDSVENSFTDVAANAWYTRAISTLAKAGILLGDDSGSFRPDDYITRAEMAAIISRFDNLTELGKTFNDIEGHWAQRYIELAATNGWINGYEDGSFRPNADITRAETFAMINRVLERHVVSQEDLLLDEMNVWIDNMDPSVWYYYDVQEATNNHECQRIDMSTNEKWTVKLTDIDWASYQF